MKIPSNPILSLFKPIHLYFNKERRLTKDPEEPLRSELYSSEQMDKHAYVLAKSHKLSQGKPSDNLLRRLEENENKLLEVRDLLVGVLRKGKVITPAAEWLLDNFYLIEEQIVIARKHLPKGYSENLPYLAEGPSAGRPRVYDIVLEIISHRDGRVDIRSLRRYINAYQQYTVLDLGELWAIPIMLRLAVIENLRRVSGIIAKDMIDHNHADHWADKMLDTVQENSGDLVLTVAEMAREKPMLNGPFVASFKRKLQGKGPELAMPLDWLEKQLSGLGENSNDLVHHENQKQAADQVSVSNCIGTLRFIGSTDWREFVESLSHVERILSRDITGVYPMMDFATRDSYRHVVETIAKASSMSETEVAELVLQLVENNGTDSENFKKRHLGYYLIKEGVKETERAANAKFSFRQRVVKAAAEVPVLLYIFSIVVLTVLFTWGMASLSFSYLLPSWGLGAFLIILFLMGSGQLAISMINWLSTIFVSPKLLPRMDFSKGIPSNHKTLVVVPTMITGEEYVEELIEGLEVRFLANKENNLYFGLITDFQDADQETLPTDQGLLELTCSKISELNKRYSRQGEDVFFLFHRPRKWNPVEQKWMGYERKRGKLTALNALILGKQKDEFSVIEGDYQILREVKFVITLDSDTQMPRDAAHKIISAMAHPLNKPVYDPAKKRVVDGYGILQPRVASGIPEKKTLYLRMQGDMSGIDPYSRMSSDVYQDLFGEGSFIGKGIYDVAVFEEAVGQAFEENRILSHDLLEGCYTRSGLLSDVFLYDDNPDNYLLDVKRSHRWIRGDWQIAAWLLPFVRNAAGKRVKNNLSTLSRWKIFDNLRRSLMPISLLLLLMMGWFVLPFPWFWTLAVTLIILLAVMAAAGWQLVHKPEDITLKNHLHEVGVSVRDTIIRFIFGLGVLPYEAWRYTDAVIRTIFRLSVTKRKLLEWTPSAAVSIGKNDIIGNYRLMWFAPILSLLCIFLFANNQVDTMLVSFPFLILWLISPALAWRTGLPETDKMPELPKEQLLYLHKLSRKTWAYYEEFVTEEDNFLPPDNFQEKHIAAVASRTSPTNMGLALLANLTAYDFGYIMCGNLLLRTDQTLGTMLRLDRYKGHFYNWYDTRSLQTLNPRYVSAVDSGNLAGHLLTLKQGLLEIPSRKIFKINNYKGIVSTVAILVDYAKDRHADIFKNLHAHLEAAMTSEEESLYEVHTMLKAINTEVEALVNALAMQPEDSLSRWSQRLQKQLYHLIHDLDILAPWLEYGPSEISGFELLDQIPSLEELAQYRQTFQAVLDENTTENFTAVQKEWLEKVTEAIGNGADAAYGRIVAFNRQAVECEEMSTMEYDFLFDPSTNFLRIGYNVDEQRRDEGFYDLLASEARLGIFVAISQGKIPQESWFSLGRILTETGNNPILLSWSGSMFEYLMPNLVMPSYENTLLNRTNLATVNRQIEYGNQKGIPWGISESGFNMVDSNLNYQYKAFGVPGIGLKRGLEEELVIAPYASMMALMVSPKKAANNLQQMSKLGFEGELGFYEAVDYSPNRLPRGKDFAVVESYMVHHQGMGFLGLAYLLLDKPMQQRFVAELRFQATLLLLQEKMPRPTVFYAHTADILDTTLLKNEAPVRCIRTPHTIIPEIKLLCNGKYQVMVTNSGAGYSRWKDIAVTRWREDTTKDDKGIFCYIKDVKTGNFWSNTHHPTLRPAKNYEVAFSQGHVEFKRHDYGIDTKTEIIISPEDDVEIRRIKLINKTNTPKTLEITSYAEIVLASQASDEAHPAFSNLFVQTSIDPEHRAIFCSRRPRSESEKPPWMFHMMEFHGKHFEDVSYETDRMQFIGRGRSLANPMAMHKSGLSGKEGAVLDPILSIRYRVELKPHQMVTLDMIYGISEDQESCVQLMHKFRDQYLKKRAFELSWTHSQVMLRQINATEEEAQLYDKLAAAVIYPNPILRAEPQVIQNNYRGQSGLWSHSVSGDIPIVLLRIFDQQSIQLVRQMVQAHAYWKLKGLAVDLVIWNEDHGSYRQLLQEQIQGMVIGDAGISQPFMKKGGVFVKSADQLSTEDRILFESVARVIIYDNRGSLIDQINRRNTSFNLPPILEMKPMKAIENEPQLALPENLLFYNGMGGFSEDGNTYHILTDQNNKTPAPWVNVIANPEFGSVVSDQGSAYTWARNAHAYRITPWNNDPVSDIGGEAFYIRDEDYGNFWSPTPYPVSSQKPYMISHSFGYSTFRHINRGIESEMKVFVDKDDPIKFIVIKLKNHSGKERHLSLTGYMEIILGDLKSKTNMHILSEVDNRSGALLFRNRYNSAFAEQVSFFKTDAANFSYTTDRAVFVGRNENLSNPHALHRKRLSGRVGAGIDSCAAIQVKVNLLNGEEKEVVFMLGSSRNLTSAHQLLAKYATKDAVDTSFGDMAEYWKATLGLVQVHTPDQALNVLANGWLPYQTLACRIYARSGFYQSGGAFGFRDQLQDVLALLNIQPEIARNQILLSASRQFVEGDVQHWWHPPEGRGVRTKCSDDMLWLPFVVSRYVEVTGDMSILDEEVGFLESRLLHHDEESLYELPHSGNQSGSLYDHCMRAINYSLSFGPHGLPLIGAGDWNDGMDMVGHKGKGESVWLGFFLFDVMRRFEDVAASYGDEAFRRKCEDEKNLLKQRIEATSWDGKWYKRAYFDDGTPLGSDVNDECQIDAIAQSWSVLSQAGDPERALQGMNSLNERLVRRDLNLIQLLDPPFDKGGLNPGYIKGYVPGVRENGGQYSHAAVWALMAFAALGDRDRVWELFQLIQPIGHADNEDKMRIYKVEPYVMAADVYANESHRGRGGWTWYTGSSGWMYQFIVNSLLGMQVKSGFVSFKPCFPLQWPSVYVRQFFGSSVYHIDVFQTTTDAESWWDLDGERGPGDSIELTDDGREHQVKLYIKIN